MQIAILKATAFFYLIGNIFYLHFIIKLNERSARLGRMFILIGAILHAAGLTARYLSVGYMPVTSLFESLSFFSFVTVCVFLAFELKHNVRVLGVFVAPVALVLAVCSAVLSGHIRPLAPALNSGWLPVHALLLFLGYAVFTVAFGAGIMYLMMERELKAKRIGPIFRRLPSLDVLDDINSQCLKIGFPLLTLGIITGSIWAKYAWGSYWSWDPKEVWSLITWFLYAALLHGRITVGWRGRKAAILAIAGFCSILFTFLGVNLLMSGLHSYTNL
ncbi:MAG: c-type cytochrome biogenesis protein CcsB [Syntrophorhabdaceae bacterium]|nr:c-type cytochrome biogenesis protein CcsB [Syntrophorhabdaceae bacterium]